MLADCYLQTGQDQELVALLKPREQMFGDDLAYAFLLGTALLHTGDIAEGQKYVDRVFGAGESAEAHLLMGIAHLGQQDYPAAKTELERAVKLNPQLPTAHSLYGRSLLALGEQDAAERAFRQELELNVNDFEANLQLGNMRKAAQQFAEASTYLERATTIRPNDLTARKLLASLRLQTGKVEEAVAMLEAIAKDAPDAGRSPRPARHRLQPAQAKRRCGSRAGDRRSSERRSAGEAARRRDGPSTEGPADERAVRSRLASMSGRAC